MEKEKDVLADMLQEVPPLVEITTIAQFGLMDEDIELFSKLLKKVILESRRAGFRNEYHEFKELAEDIYSDVLSKLGLVDEDLNLPKQ